MISNASSKRGASKLLVQSIIRYIGKALIFKHFVQNIVILMYVFTSDESKELGMTHSQLSTLLLYN